jgi:predicted Zn-dependent peptidase
VPTPAEFAVVGVNPQQAKADAKRYAKQFKKHYVRAPKVFEYKFLED